MFGAGPKISAGSYAPIQWTCLANNRSRLITLREILYPSEALQDLITFLNYVQSNMTQIDVSHSRPHNSSTVPQRKLLFQTRGVGTGGGGGKAPPTLKIALSSNLEVLNVQNFLARHQPWWRLVRYAPP